ncbi:hypothetical protein ACHAXR_006510 [Thalassiosira sp. AJA248-18]
MKFKWRQCIPCAVILSKRISNARPLGIPTTSLTSSSSSSITSEGMNCEHNGTDIGGGAINEKPRLYQQTSDSKGGEHGDIGIDSWNPSENLSQMMHALVGLDRYPNYLGRFQDVGDMITLEEALESKLSDVRRQRLAIMERRSGIQQLVRKYISSMNDINTQNDSYDAVDLIQLWRHHPVLSPPKTWSELRDKVLQGQAFKVAYQSASSNKKRKSKSHKSQKQSMSTVEDIIAGSVPVDLDPSLLEDWMNQEMFDVYSVPLLTIEFCTILRTTLRELTALAETKEFSHLQLGRRPIDLDTIGLGWITDMLFHMFIQPISSHLFATTEKLVGSTDDKQEESSPLLDWRQGYVAGYSADPAGRKGANRHRLVPHTDDSEVTLNCCLGEETFEGGNVEFYGLRGTREEGQLVGKANRPNVGTALLHSGRHLHAVSDVLSGDRYALIVWSRSWSRLRSITCPCCWLNRRQEVDCICDKRWN